MVVFDLRFGLVPVLEVGGLVGGFWSTADNDDDDDDNNNNDEGVSELLFRLVY